LHGDIRVNPGVAALCGVAVILVAGTIRAGDVVGAAEDLWRPFVTVASIMVMTHATAALGVLARLAAMVIPRASGSSHRLFTYVFFLSATTAGVLNNDAAVLLLTPLIVILVRAVYPEGATPMLPFVFAVFMAAGVAPLVVANPMNMVVAEFADVGFNQYAVKMLPISLVGWLVAFVVLRFLFRRQLDASKPTVRPDPPRSWTRPQLTSLAVLGAVLVAYPIVSYFGGPIWSVAVAGAVAQIVLCHVTLGDRISGLVRHGISWETLVFLFGVFLMAVGLEHVGVVDRLADLYSHSRPAEIGVISAVGSAAINNHPMALINVLSLESAAGVGREHILAALIGGDLGPRLLPMGSLAGLLWIGALRRAGIEVTIRRFFLTGLAVTAPSLAVSLFLLHVL
jgi:arsenical pump membrane protein